MTTYYTTCPVSGAQVSLNAYCIPGDRGLASNWRGICPDCGKKHKAERIIKRPRNASDHECDARCINATGHRCECSCKGEFHGVGQLGLSTAEITR